MNDDDKNIDDIKEKLKKKREDTEYVGYTPKVSKDKEATKQQKETKPAADKEEEETSSLKIEHYKDFEGPATDTKKTKDKKQVESKSEKAGFLKENEKNKDKEKDKKKKKKKQFKFKRIHMYISLVAFLLICLGVLLWYVFSSASDVKEITFNGNSLVTEEELEERIGFTEGDKMFSISANDARANIELLPVVEEVSVERNWPNGVTVNINEYKAVAYISNDDLYFPVLENSRIQRGYPTVPRNAPIIYNFEGEEFDALVTDLNKIEEDILAGMSEIYFRPTDNSLRRIHVFMNDGQEMVADYETFSEKMNYYVGIRQEIGEETDGIIDMEVGTSYLPYDSADAREIKENIYNEPAQADYIENINQALDEVRTSLNEVDNNDRD